MKPTPMKGLLALAALGTLAHTGTAARDVHEGSTAAQISFEVPKDWVVQNETELFISGFIVPPEPLFALVASPAIRRAHPGLTLCPGLGPRRALLPVPGADPLPIPFSHGCPLSVLPTRATRWV